MKIGSLVENTYNCVEYCYTLEYYARVPPIVRVAVPSLMSLMPKYAGVSIPITVDGGLCNDIDCKPNLPSSICLQGFLSVPAVNSTIEVGGPHTHRGTEIYEELPEGSRCVIFFPAYNLEGRFTTIKIGGVI